MGLQAETALTIGDIAPLVEEAGMAVTYESVLARTRLEAPVGYIGLIGMPDEVTNTVLNRLGLDPEEPDPERALVAEMVEAATLRDNGLYVINATKADRAQSILGSRRLIHPNGLARIVCEETLDPTLKRIPVARRRQGL